MKRRVCAVLIAGLTFIWSVAATAQSTTKIPRLCFIEFDQGSSDVTRPFFDALATLGYIDGKTIVIDHQFAEGRNERYPELARACVQRQSDVIVVRTTPAALAAKAATGTVPIVMVSLGDPVGTGLVDSLARPGGNITGTTFVAPAVAAKRLALLKETVPRISKVLMLSYPVDPIDSGQIMAVARTAQTLGVTIDVREVRKQADIAMAFDGAIAARCEAMLVPSALFFVSHRAEVLERSTRQKWPGVFSTREFAEDGGLLYFSGQREQLYARAATLVDRILKGAAPASLPVEQPTKYDLIVNLKAAKALGITVPLSILARADEVIE